MINKIFNSLDIKQGGSIFHKPFGGFGYQYTQLQGSGGFVPNTTVWNNAHDSNIESWGMGTGILINTVGTMIFTNASGFGLRDVTIVNRGPNPAYVAYNVSGWDVTKAIYIKTDESSSFRDTVIESVWVAAATGTCTIVGDGLQHARK